MRSIDAHNILIKKVCFSSNGGVFFLYVVVDFHWYSNECVCVRVMFCNFTHYEKQMHIFRTISLGCWCVLNVYAEHFLFSSSVLRNILYFAKISESFKRNTSKADKLWTKLEKHVVHAYLRNKDNRAGWRGGGGEGERRALFIHFTACIVWNVHKKKIYSIL